MGNEKPIVITRDVWTSPELLLTVQSREFDSRSGETTYRLGKLRRGEPDPALMKMPADYDASRGAAGAACRLVKPRLSRATPSSLEHLQAEAEQGDRQRHAHHQRQHRH